MHILIDGYNLIRQSVDLKRFERQSLEAGRKALIAWLARYHSRKDHRITSSLTAGSAASRRKSAITAPAFT